MKAATPILTHACLQRRRWRISGRVQGVGFRPFVYRIASASAITGAVWNDTAGVVVEGQGSCSAIAAFDLALRKQPPPAADISQVTSQSLPIVDNEKAFVIRPSAQDIAPTAEIAIDTAVCPACLAELRDPADKRRFGYPLINCSECGPRFSIIRRIPYDRPNTTMTGFQMCDACRREYDNPRNRRFHAQPTACHLCGPTIQLVDPRGRVLADRASDAIVQAVHLLAQGRVIAIKGLGGFHLAVRADDQAAVEALRQRKHRPAKPLALMCASVEAALSLVDLSSEGMALLMSPAAPIVLAARKPDAPVAASVAPGHHRLGVMLAYTPLHHLLLDQAASHGLKHLVMTSANDNDEPLVYDNADALARLGDLCDAFLWHNRPIERPVDDSVVIDVASPQYAGGGLGSFIYLRRARGMVPSSLLLPSTAGVTLSGISLGAELKNTLAIVRNGQIILSQHLGDLVQAKSFELFQRTIDDMCELFAIKPRWIAHDLHPGYLSTAHGKRLAAKLAVDLVGVQHHHAHAAAVLAEHGKAGPALAVVCDGTGFGLDGTIWGGELLEMSLNDFKRLGHLRPMLLPGGDASAKQPWRSAMALLRMVYGDDCHRLVVWEKLAGTQEREFIEQMLLTGAACIATTSMGRWFDAMAALLGLCHVNRYEAEAPMALEATASQAVTPVKAQDVLFDLGDSQGRIEVDLRPMVRMIVERRERDADVSTLAALFHETVAAAWEAAVMKAVGQTGLKCIVLSGGVFCNQLLSESLARRLQAGGLEVLRHMRVPPNDGGIALGQAAVAARRSSGASPVK